MVSDLSKYGIVERKSSTVELPQNITKDLRRHLIRGIFDGDGTVFINSKNRTYFGFYGNYYIVSQIKDVLRKELNISDNKITDKGTVCQLVFSKKEDILNFYNYIYKDCTIWMKRKKKYLRPILKTIKNKNNNLVNVNIVITILFKSKIVS